MLLLFVALYLAATLAIGWWSSRFVKDTNDFVVGGRKMPLMIVASGLFATWFGSETVMGASSEFLDKGILGVIEDPFGAALCLFLIGFFMARPLYRLNLYTFSDYFKQRYNRPAELTSAVMMIPSYFGWIAAQLIALATVLNVLTDGVITISMGVMICACIVMCYTFVGGMWAVSITDTVQTVMIIGGMVIILVDVLQSVGGIANVMASTPKDFFRLTPPIWTTHSSVEYFAAWITVGLGSIPQQDVFMRVMSAKNEKTAIYASFTSALMYLTIAFMPLMIALCGKMLYPALANGDEASRQMLIPQMVLQHSGLFLQVMFFGALLSAILSTTSGAILAPSTVIGENIVKPFFKNMTDKQLLAVMRWAVVVVTAMSVVFASFESSIYELVSQSSAISLVSLFVPLVSGLYWKRASAVGSVASMLIGFSIWLLAEIAQAQFPIFATEWNLTFPTIIYGLVASVVSMIIGSLLYPQKK
jgi:solute:Na+ symporter, SSS family